MSTETPTISIRLPKTIWESLDRAAKETRRSRSYLMQEALQRHLGEIVREQTGEGGKRLSRLLALGGAGRREGATRSAEEIDAHVRWLRDNA